MEGPTTKVLFLDRDGVINRNRDDYVKSWSEFEFLPGALDALRCLARLQYRVVVVTNQSAINRGIVAREVVEGINHQMLQEVVANGGVIEAVFYCPHRPDENCECRKPKPGLLFMARDSLSLRLSEAFLIGDRMSDIEAACAAGLRASILLMGDSERAELESRRRDYPCDFLIAGDLSDAVDLLGATGLDASTPSNG